MDSTKVGKFILNLRRKSNLTQQEFANMFGVTYQAVSKWENGKNIPDILILKDICKKFNVDINEILDGQHQKKKNYISSIMIICIVILIVIVVVILGKYFNNDSFEFKTLSSSCENFNIFGSVAYNRDKSSIYISNIKYCGGNDTTKYKKIECVLYESSGNIETKIDYQFTKEDEKDITLEEFLQHLTFNVDNYKASCSNFATVDLYLQINATDSNNKITTYKIPLELQENCAIK